MRLNQRPVRREDFAACYEALGEPFVFAREHRQRVPAVLRHWFETGGVIGHAIEDHGELQRPRTVGLSIVLFISDAVAGRILSGQAPFVRNELVQRELAGDSQVLTAAQMRRANQGDGVHMFYFNHALTNRDLSAEERHLVHTRWADTFPSLRGFNLRNIFCEIHQDEVCAWGLACGMEPRHTWRGVSVDATSPKVDLFQIGTTREEALKRIGSPTADLFAQAQPRFHFTRRQQELLQSALWGATDQALAGELHLSLAAVKKRWVAIYEQVSACAPGWLESLQCTPLHGEGRGSEKRRTLLNYLRQHPEELHPANARMD